MSTMTWKLERKYGPNKSKIFLYDKTAKTK